MNRFLLISLFLFTVFPSIAWSQQVFVSNKSVVRDSTGKLYEWETWSQMVKNDYGLRPVNSKDPNTEFILYKLTDEQLELRKSRPKPNPESLPKPGESFFFTTGSPVSLPNTTDINGNKLHLKNSKGKIIVLNFWFINCGPCRREIPDLNALVDSFSTDSNVLFLGIATDDKASLKTFLEKQPFQYTIIDNGRFISDRFGIKLFPTHVIIDQEGKVYFHTSGLRGNTVYWLKKSIKELLAKETVSSSSQ